MSRDVLPFILPAYTPISLARDGFFQGSAHQFRASSAVQSAPLRCLNIAKERPRNCFQTVMSLHFSAKHLQIGSHYRLTDTRTTTPPKPHKSSRSPSPSSQLPQSSSLPTFPQVSVDTSLESIFTIAVAWPQRSQIGHPQCLQVFQNTWRRRM